MNCTHIFVFSSKVSLSTVLMFRDELMSLSFQSPKHLFWVDRRCHGMNGSQKIVSSY